MQLRDVIARLRAGKKNDEGFTLIELLVVVVIIGVLVAIAVPVYLNYRQGAADKSAQSDVRGAISAVEQYYTNNSNQYPASNIKESNDKGDKPSMTLPKGNTGGSDGTITLSDKTQLGYLFVAGTTSAPAHYLLCANNTGGSGKWYLYDSSAGGSVKDAGKVLNTSTCAATAP